MDHANIILNLFGPPNLGLTDYRVMQVSFFVITQSARAHPGLPQTEGGSVRQNFCVDSVDLRRKLPESAARRRAVRGALGESIPQKSTEVSRFSWTSVRRRLPRRKLPNEPTSSLWEFRAGPLESVADSTPPIFQLIWHSRGIMMIIVLIVNSILNPIFGIMSNKINFLCYLLWFNLP